MRKRPVPKALRKPITKRKESILEVSKKSVTKALRRPVADKGKRKVLETNYQAFLKFPP